MRSIARLEMIAEFDFTYGYVSELDLHGCTVVGSSYLDARCVLVDPFWADRDHWIFRQVH
jgi:hypothetical protein